MSKKLSKYIAAFNYIDNTLIVLSATSGGIGIISFTSVIGIRVIETLTSQTLIDLEISHEEFKT